MSKEYRDWWDYFILKKFPTGRRHCTSCKCWRPVSDFYVARLHPSGRPLILRAKCKSCERVAYRLLRGYNPSPTGKPGQPRRWKSDAEKQKAQRKAIKKDPERLAARRETSALSKRLQRRREGVPPRRYTDGRNYWQIEYWNEKHPEHQIIQPSGPPEQVLIEKAKHAAAEKARRNRNRKGPKKYEGPDFIGDYRANRKPRGKPFPKKG